MVLRGGHQQVDQGRFQHLVRGFRPRTLLSRERPSSPLIDPVGILLLEINPCYVTHDKVSPKTDVFNFGILLLEIISGRMVLAVFNSMLVSTLIDSTVLGLVLTHA